MQHRVLFAALSFSINIQATRAVKQHQELVEGGGGGGGGGGLGSVDNKLQSCLKYQSHRSSECTNVKSISLSYIDNNT